MGWFSKKKQAAPVAEPSDGEAAQFLIPKDVDWTVEDISALEQAGEWEEALARWRRLLEPFQDPQIADQIAGVKSHRIIWQHIGICCRRLSRREEALEAFGKAESLARNANDSAAVAAILKDAGCVHRAGGDLPAALRSLDEALASATALADRRLMGKIHDERSLCYGAQGEMERALEEARTGFTLITGRTSEGPGLETRLMTNLAVVFLEQGREQEARGLFEQALVRAREAGDAESEALIRGNLGVVR